MALCAFLPSIWAAPQAPVLLDKSAPLADPAQTSLTTTPSISAFLSNNWVPPSITNASVNNSLNNNSTTVLDTSVPPVYTASAPNKNGVVAWTGESRFQFLQDDWTPSTPVEIIQIAPYKKGQMS